MEALDVNLAAFLQWLLKATLQGSLLVCLIMLIKVTLRERLPARWHYCLWLVLLIRLALPWAPQSRVSIYGLIPHSLPSQRATSSPPVARSVGEDAKSDALRREGGADRTLAADQTGTAPQVGNKGADSAETRVPATTVASGGPSSREHSRGQRVAVLVARVLAWLWLAGGVVLAGYILLRAVGLWRAVISERPVTDQQILDLLEDCKMQMRVRTLVGVVITDKVKTPALFGFLRPRILLPQGLIETLGPDDLHCVFLHELAHLKRRDIYLAWLVCLLQVLHWFNPLLWFAFRRMRADQEMATDALALSTAGTDETRLYGRTIVNLLERFSRPQHLPSLAGILETSSLIERRMTMITKFTNNAYRVSALGIVSIILLACVSLPEDIRAKAAEKPSLEAKGGPTLRRVMDCTANAAVSPDNRLVCYPKYDDSGELIVHSLATGKEDVIKASAGAAGHEGDPLSPVFSPDGRTIAYTVADEPQDHADKAHERSLYLINADGTKKRSLCRGILPIVWSSDGKKILGMTMGEKEDPTYAKKILGMTMGEKEDPTYIVWVSTEDGSIERRAEFPTKRWQAVSLSPDGRYLAFDRPQEGDPNATWYAGRWDIFSLDLNTGQESPIVRNPAGEVLLGWAPSGKHILFLSDRMGTWDGWLQPVADGVPAGQAQLVSRNIGHISPGRFAHNGSYYYQVEYNSSRIYFAEIDLQTGELVGAPKTLEGTGYDKCVDWSPDGRFAVYSSQNPDRPGPFTIHVRDVAGGTERTFEFDPKLTTLRCLRWDPDGKSLLASGVSNWMLGRDGNRKEGIDSRVYRIDIENGKGTVLIQSERTGVREAELSPNGKTVFYSCRAILRGEQEQVAPAKSLLIRRELSSGVEKPLFEFSAGTGWSWAVSRSGEYVAVAVNEERGNPNAPAKKIMVIPSAGGQIKEFVRWGEAPGAIWSVAWTPDGKGILFVLQRDINDDTTMELWHVAIDAPQPRKIMEADLGGWSGVRVHPDGRRIAFHAARRYHELWAMENILPGTGVPARPK